MKSLLSTVMLTLILLASPLQAKPRQAPAVNPFTLDSMYVRPDGAILTWMSGGVVDPYFPTKALLLAQHNGMDITDLGTHWVKWMLTQQDASGLFDRYCFKEDQTYTTCAGADADDAMMALWIELIYLLAPRSGLPDSWLESVHKAQYQLDRIYDKKSTVFMVSQAMPVGLLMDNIEIYAAYKSIERSAIRIGDNETAKAYRARAEYLKNGIIPTFWDVKTHSFKASTQARTSSGFYPDTVVQLMPLMYGFNSPSIKLPANFYKKWMKDHRQEWFSLIGKDYPWGLLAVLAVEQGDMMTANCWLQKSAPSRYSLQWNVLDESAFQVVSLKLHRKWPHALPACTILPAKEDAKS